MNNSCEELRKNNIQLLSKIDEKSKLLSNANLQINNLNNNVNLLEEKIKNTSVELFHQSDIIINNEKR